jgi:lipid A 3-O-deacylase
MSAYKYLPRCLVVLSVLTFGSGASCLAAQGVVGDLIPSTAFVQAGIGDQSTRAYIGGFTWDWNWRHHYGFGTLSGYFDADFGRWTTDRNGVKGYAWMTQVGLTPVLRFRPTGAAADWFAEIGVGPNYILPLYRSGSKRFSSEFNFGDHVAIGRDFGGRDQHELALRAEHFSNAGISHPNPGENFVQLRYSYRFR